MKVLEIEQMEKVQGSGFIDGACTGIALASLAFLAGVVTLGAGSGLVLGIAAGVCFTNGILTK